MENQPKTPCPPREEIFRHYGYPEDTPDIPLHRGIGLTGNWIDKPITVAPTLMVADLKEAIEEGEPRAEFVQATFEIDPNDPAHLIPTVEVNIRDE